VPPADSSRELGLESEGSGEGGADRAAGDETADLASGAELGLEGVGLFDDLGELAGKLGPGWPPR
jgi:hypothetical protein